MSHIVRGSVKVAYTDISLLKRALKDLGNLTEDDQLYRVGIGLTRERYSLVLTDPQKSEHRLGYNLEGEVWSQFQEDFGSSGRWNRKLSAQIQDRYIAYHYEKNLVDEGYTVSVQEHNDGTLELVANEGAW